MSEAATPTTTTHQARIDAPAAVVFQLIADAVAWPRRFGPTVHVQRTALGAGAERLRIWATGNGEVLSWTSRRELDEERLVVRFRQEVTNPPIAAMGGTWWITPVGPSACVLTLDHDFRAVDDDPAKLAWIHTATDRNSTTELGNIKALAESWEAQESLVFSFEDTELIDGDPKEIYDFLYRADLWGERLGHVGSIDVRETTAGDIGREDGASVQWMTMETRAMDGSTHTTESIRICFPDSRIVYKQLVPPALMTVHTGVWSVEPAGDGAGPGVRVTSQHTVAVKPSAITQVLGEGADLAAARDFIRRAVGGNSAATLGLAKRFVESARV